MAQKKEQNKTPEKELNTMEISSLPASEFKTLVIRMLKKKTQAEMKVTLSEMKNFQGINNAVDEAENQINDLEHKEERKHSIRAARRRRNP